MKKKQKITTYILLHISVFIYSMVSLFAKSASQYDFLSFDYISRYFCVIAILGVYAVLWQQVIKRIALNVAYANKAALVVWGLLWGCLVLNETVDPIQFIGVVLIIIGVVIVGVENGKLSD